MAAVTGRWHRFDYDNKKATAPPNMQLVWIVEEYQADGVTAGYYDRGIWRVWNGSDDCSVSWWAHMEMPEPPVEWTQREDVDVESPPGW